MPRVVPDQKNKYETDELFKKLSQDVDVSCTDVCMRLEMSQYACAPETSVCVCVCRSSTRGTGTGQWRRGGGGSWRICRRDTLSLPSLPLGRTSTFSSVGVPCRMRTTQLQTVKGHS
ncbi:hypothetical protein GBAR_LOCUS19510 [Geodia barretti]|uniref:Uncharacterized protein n=1 Tax=Geodia barretti TaxID=519541 RepID=A0AA35X1N2_GEOBA|nr:hypothetical protein GBAR_LOCUS19510 [Geodia barretti]